MNQKQQPAPERAPPGPDAQVQLGEGRGVDKDERLKRLVKRHPRRDEPKVESVEPGELPPP